MISLSLGEIAYIVNGTLSLGQSEATDETIIAGLTDTDSRMITPGDIFVAKPGETTDGHLFAPAAVDNGAALVLVDHLLDIPVPQILVADTVVAMGLLATEVVARVRALGKLKIIGITGSNGKTTTKNFVGTMCEKVGQTIYPRDSFNNEVGTPITMLRVTEATEFLVLEIGSSGPGHIRRLTDMARPDIAVVLMVGLAHAGEFGALETTISSKSELVQALDETGTAILNCDDPNVLSMAPLVKGSTLTFGQNESAHMRVSDISTSREGTRFTLTFPDASRHAVSFKVLGEHHAMNAAAAATVGYVLGFPAPLIVSSLSQITRAERWRMEVMGNSDITIINDAYNASPDSMAAALKTLRQIAEDQNRTVAVLGEMAELGEIAGAEYDRLALLAVRLGINLLVVVGDNARRMHISAINEGSWDGESKFFSTRDEAYDYLTGELRTGDIVVVKSSNSADLRILGDKLGTYYE